MAEHKKTTPELFKANLFSSPGPGPGPGTSSSGLSFGLASDSFNSSFSLVAPALTTPNRSPPAPQKQQQDNKPSAPATVTSTPVPVVKTTPISALATPTPLAEAELSNVPLDSPPPSTSSALTTDSTPHHQMSQAMPVGPGWNDPPLKPTPPPPPSGSIPVSGIETESFPLQPLAGQVTPQPSALNQQQVGANPYRLARGGGGGVVGGVGGVGKRVVYGDIALPPAQPMQPAVTTTLPPPSLPPPTVTGSALPLQPAEVASFPVAQEVGVVQHHWFYLRPSETYWIPFSLSDSGHLEQAWFSSSTTDQVVVATDGGRYDVDLTARTRSAIYWTEPVSHVRRCSWFYKGDSDRWFMPYAEDVAAHLEEEYCQAMRRGVWGGKVEVGGGEAVVMHSQLSMAHYPASQFQPITHEVDYSHPRSVLRGFAEIEHVEQGEQSRIDHLVFVVHGIGEHHDLNFRCLVDCVDDFREVSQLMLRTHRFAGQAPQEGDNGGRVEYLPVHWHAALHGDSLGVDHQLQTLSLSSISRLRNFTNSTLLDILFFTSPVYLQTIVDQVTGEMNRMYDLFLQRNPGYFGGVSVMGHSLGSCILFDILSHQTGQMTENEVPETPLAQETSSQLSEEQVGEGQEEEEEDVDIPITLEGALSLLGLAELTDTFTKEQFDFETLLMTSNEDLRELGIAMGHRKKLLSFISSQGEKIRAAKERRARCEAERKAREQEMSKKKAAEEKVQKHTTLQGVKYVKGGTGTGQPLVTFSQLHFRTENLFTLGSPIGLFLIVRGVEELGPEYKLPFCRQMFNIFHPLDPVAYRLEPLLCDTPPEKPVLMPHHKGRKRFHLELYETVETVGASMKQYVVEGMRNMWQQLNELARSHRSGDQPPLQSATVEELDTPTITEPEVGLVKEIGLLNGGRRVDYVLQEKPIEKLNQYLFALSSHLSYWRSEDTALFILKEVYEEMNPELIKS